MATRTTTTTVVRSLTVLLMSSAPRRNVVGPSVPRRATGMPLTPSVSTVPTATAVGPQPRLSAAWSAPTAATANHHVASYAATYLPVSHTRGTVATATVTEPHAAK